MSQYRPYPKYKDTGEEWLGNVPEHWDVRRSKNVFREINQRSQKGDEVLLSVSEYYGVKPRADVINDDELLSRAETLEGYKKCMPGDLVMNIMLAWKRGLGVTDFEGIVSPAYSVFRNISGGSPRYFHSLLRTDIYISEFKRQSTGVIDSRLRLYPEVFGFVDIILPPKKEQQQIASFLDQETTRIDALIEKKQRLIKLLQEKRQAIITQAVTKGLDPNVPMKDSAVEWLGKVPEHWEIKTVKRVAQIKYGIGEPPNYVDEGTPLIRATNVKAGAISETNLVYVDPNDIPPARIVWLKPGDIIVVRSGAYTGDSAIIPPKYRGAIAGFDMVLTAKTIDPMFLAFVLLSSYVKESQIDQLKMRAAQPHLNAEELGTCLLVVPSLEEQKIITSHINKNLAHIDMLIEKNEISIELLQERRSALITAAVTGQIDVREAI